MIRIFRYIFLFVVLCMVMSFQSKNDKVYSVKAFGGADVLLKDSWIKQRERLNIAFLHKLDPDRLLFNFRINAGISYLAKPLDGWESPECGLRGHFTVHYLSACASFIRNN